MNLRQVLHAGRIGITKCWFLWRKANWRTWRLGARREPKTSGSTHKEPFLGLSRLCSATLEQLLAFGATFCGFSNLEQVLPFRAIFEQNIGLEHISSTNKSTISWKTSIHANFLKAYQCIWLTARVRPPRLP